MFAGKKGNVSNRTSGEKSKKSRIAELAHFYAAPINRPPKRKKLRSSKSLA
jgi:hypothetical protein